MFAFADQNTKFHTQIKTNIPLAANKPPGLPVFVRVAVLGFNQSADTLF